MPSPEVLVPLIVAAVLSYFAFRYFKYGGFRGALYGSAVVKTVGEVQLQRYAGVSAKLRVHVLEDGRIVLEKSSRAFLSFSIDGMPMSVNDAAELIGLLQQARL